MDTNLLYGEMVGSWIAHLAIPFATFMLVGLLGQMSHSSRVLIFLGICTALSFVCQFILLTVLQSSACSGMKSYKSVTIGAAIAAIITAVMVAIPSYLESMRLVVSQLFFAHKPLLTPALAQMNNILVQSGKQVLAASMAPVQSGGAAISQEDYDAQTFQEIASGASYWAAFAGAYGIGIGSVYAATCPAPT